VEPQAPSGVAPGPAQPRPRGEAARQPCLAGVAEPSLSPSPSPSESRGPGRANPFLGQMVISLGLCGQQAWRPFLPARLARLATKRNVVHLSQSIPFRRPHIMFLPRRRRRRRDRPPPLAFRRRRRPPSRIGLEDSRHVFTMPRQPGAPWLSRCLISR
jgi:hypothetical protein